MSQENVEIVREIYARLRASCLTPTMSRRTRSSIHRDVPRATRTPRHRGDAGFPVMALAGLNFMNFDPEKDFDVYDERVLVFVRATSTERASGTPIETRIAHEFTIRNRLIVRVKVHRDRSEALKAVGLEE